MDHINKPRGLIRYASENNIESKAKTTYTWRLKLYTIVLTALLAFLAILLITRDDVSARIIRTPGQMYQKMEDGRISNLYNIKLANKTRKNIHLTLKLEHHLEGEIKLVSEVNVPKESYFQTSFFVILKKEQLRKRKTKVTVGIYEDGEQIKTVTATFLGPAHH
jgi:polyferredoxin